MEIGGLKKVLAVGIGLTLSLLIVSPSREGALAAKSPAWPFGSGCKASQVFKTRNSNKEVCANQNGKYKWVKTLQPKDVYDLSSFCSTTIKVEASGALCGWNERWGLFLVRAFRPRDNCVELLRQIVYKEADLYVSNPVLATDLVATFIQEAQRSYGCTK